MERLPLELARLHGATELGATVSLDLHGDAGRIRAIVEGAGFVVDRMTARNEHVELRATRALMLPDFVRPGLRVLFCGYNPSIYAAERGVPFARPGNRFWPAALASGLVVRDRDPWHAVEHRDVGFTDMVKRATTAAAELSKDELREGVLRVTQICEWLTPAVLCVLGIGAWRQLVDRRAPIGWQDQVLGETRVYVMPNPSGLNASTQHLGFVEHLQQVAAAR